MPRPKTSKTFDTFITTVSSTTQDKPGMGNKKYLATANNAFNRKARTKKREVVYTSETESNVSTSGRQKKCKTWLAVLILVANFILVGCGVGLALYFSHFAVGVETDSEASTNRPVNDIPTHNTSSSLYYTDTVSPYSQVHWANIRGSCGLPKISPELISSRITGGTEARPHSWPWQISIVKYISFGDGYFSVKHICGGTLIGPNFVITAVHCFLEKETNIVTSKPKGYRVILGGHAKSKFAFPAAFSNISRIIHHPLHNLDIYTILRVNPTNDIALLELETRFDPTRDTPAVAFACLPIPNTIPPVGKRCWISGWGKTQSTGYETVLKQASQKIISEVDCDIFYARGVSYDKHLCVKENYMGTCQGDSGGPLVCQGDDNRWTIYGATSFGPVPCGAGPTVFTAVSFYMEWICCVVKQLGPCSEIRCKT